MGPEARYSLPCGAIAGIPSEVLVLYPNDAIGASVSAFSSRTSPPTPVAGIAGTLAVGRDDDRPRGVPVGGGEGHDVGRREAAERPLVEPCFAVETSVTVPSSFHTVPLATWVVPTSTVVRPVSAVVIVALA